MTCCGMFSKVWRTSISPRRRCSSASGATGSRPRSAGYKEGVMKFDFLDFGGGVILTVFATFVIAALGSLAVLMVAGTVWCVMALFG